MKKYLFFSLLILSTNLFAAKTGIVRLRGVVTSINEIEVTPDQEAQNLDILNGHASLRVATVRETSNDRLGFDILLSSQNGGYLIHEKNILLGVKYKISYDGGGYASPGIFPRIVKTVKALSGLTTLQSEVKINLPATPSALTGEYTDVLTLSIVAH